MYRAHSTINGQELVDFVAEIYSKQSSTDIKQDPIWTLFVDGSSNSQRSKANIILITPIQIQVTSAICFRFRALNNKSEYEGLIARLKTNRAIMAKRVHVCINSQVVTNKIKGTYAAKGK